jgi:hypothetical protein
MSIPAALLSLLEKAIEKIALPTAQAALIEVVENVSNHPDPIGAAQLAAMVTGSRAGSLAIINATLRLRRKARK